MTDLADRVRMTLIAAGIPAFASNINSAQGAGAEIEVDLGADEAGGVYITWQFPRAQIDEMVSYLHAGQDADSNPRLRYFFEVRRVMRDAIVAVLNAAGLAAARWEDPDDTANFQVLISSQPSRT